ncbi:Leucine-rich repeat and guanylate kinase domain-containing protein [Takifugu flavidus]|uniref:Leucine-rich repeat and guanylate kinase domain-containing protein n=1 Tax=Takifugu flavidus TaxID=433684 RepID=A0A5C6NDU4_9TELE|nr:Leucine-rich repeat and guanylate kinase domain-containing protein [Takifugu flavidus]
MEQFPPPSPSCCPPGSRGDAGVAAEPGSGESQGNTEMEKDGVVTAEMVSSCLSSLEHGVTGLKHTYHCLSFPNRNLKDISILCNYGHLQKLEVPQNEIKDLSCVSHMPLLVILDASRNQISDFFGFQPPQNLKEVNLSHNQMKKMKDLSAFCCLRKLDLGYNGFSEICGLKHCCMLTHLNLAHNKISRISGLDTLPLTHLFLPITALTWGFVGPAQSPTPTDSRPLPDGMLGKSWSGNQLKAIEGLENLKSLQVLDLSSNRITSLSGLQTLRLLCRINLEENLISDVQECKHIRDHYLLRELKLRGNPVQEQPDYRLEVVFLLQHLTLLDEDTVTVEEKVSSVNKYDPPMELAAARDHMTHLVYQMMQPQVLYDSTLICAASPYPMLVLTGPQGCGKRELTHRLCQDLGEYFAYGTCHTTRGPYYGEEEGVDYHFVSEEEFQHMIHMGKFIQTIQYGGHMYGLSRDAIEDVAREGLACCVHMELEGVLSLKKSCFEPRYILLIPTQVESYISRLSSRGLYTPAQMKAAVSRIELYAATNRQHPGFFDCVIPTNDLEEAYQKLRRVMNEYLKIKQQEETEKNNSTSPNNTPSGMDLTSSDGQVQSIKAGIQSGFASYQGETTFTRVNGTPGHEPEWNPLSPQFRPNLDALSREKSPAELASISRREQHVREAIVGKSPGVYSQRPPRSSQTAPLYCLDLIVHQGEDVSPSALASVSTSDEAPASSPPSVPSSARALSAFVDPLDMCVLGHTLEVLKGQSPEAPHPGSDQPAADTSASSDGPPASKVMAVLPPIPAGRKTPAVPGVAPDTGLALQ